MYSNSVLRRGLLSSCCFTLAGIAASLPSLATTYTVASGSSTTLATQITGTDNVIVAGGGTLVLTNTANNYTGGSQVLGGSSLQIDSDAELGATTGSLTFGNGATVGTLLFSGATTISSTRAVTLNAGSQTVNTDTYTDGIAAAITGTGALVKTGSGALILTGINTYTGSTTISAGTLQIGNGGTTGSIASSAIANAGALIFNRSDSNTYAGIISGTGTLTQAGSGTLILTGINSLTGATTISSGTLALSGSGALAFSALTNNSVFDISAVTATSATIKSLAGSGNVALGSKTLTLTSGATFSGVINGTGGLTVNGGTEILTGANTYIGTTTIGSSGTLQIGSASTTGWIASNAIVDNGTLSFSRSDDVTFAGVISGTGAVKQVGAGTLTLNGTNTYSGLTTVSAGTLVIGDSSHASASVGGAVTVANGAALTGYGSIAGLLTNGGTVVVGNGSVATLKVGGAYTQTGTLTVDISPTSASLLKVGGMATLSGTLSATFDSGTYTPTIYKILSASSLSGTFSAAGGSSGTMAYAALYPSSGTEVDLIVVPRSVGQVYGDLVTATFDNAHNLSDIALEHAAFDDSTSVSKGDKVVRSETVTTWIEGVGTTNHVNEGDGAAAFNARNRGVIFGAGMAITRDASVGTAFGYTRGSLGVADQSASATTDDYFASVSFHAAGDYVAVDTTAYYLSSSSNTTRLGASGQAVAGNLNSTVTGITGQLSHGFFGGDITPIAKVGLVSVIYGQFQESDDGLYTLAGSHGSNSSTWADLGIRFSHTFTLSSGVVLKPHLFAGMEDDVSLSSRGTSLSLINGALSSFSGATPLTGRMAVVARAGIDAAFSDTLSLQADFNGRHNDRQDFGSLSLGFSYRF